MRATKLLLALAMGLAATGRLDAQATGRIGGTVVNERGQPITSASVVIQGTRIGTLTGADGRYVLTGVAAGSHTVVASLIGFGDASQPVTVAAGQTAVAVPLSEVQSQEDRCRAAKPWRCRRPVERRKVFGLR